MSKEHLTMDDIFKAKSDLEDAFNDLEEVLENHRKVLELLDREENQLIRSAFDDFIKAGLLPGARFRLKNKEGSYANTIVYRIIGIYPEGFICIDEANPEREISTPVYRHRSMIERFEKVQ